MEEVTDGGDVCVSVGLRLMDGLKEEGTFDLGRNKTRRGPVFVTGSIGTSKTPSVSGPRGHCHSSLDDP